METFNTKTIYVSPENIDIVVAYLTLKNERKNIDITTEKQKTLTKIASEYDQNKITGIAIVRTKNLIKIVPEYNIDFKVKPYSTGKEILTFGIHTLEELEKAIGKDKLSKIEQYNN